MMQLTLTELPKLCEAVIQTLPRGGVVILQGDLASGKTTFTQSFAAFLGLEESVSSPTFSLQQQYGDRLYHYDLYNYGFDKFLSLGMMEELEHPGYHLIEWGDDKLEKWLKMAGMEYIVIKITKSNNDMRCYEVQNG